MDDALRALAHPGRRVMLRLIWDAELTSSELAARAGMTKPGASQHLKLLREAGLVHVRVDVNRRLYRVDRERMAELRSMLDDFWRGPLDRLTELAERLAPTSVDPVDMDQ